MYCNGVAVAITRNLASAFQELRSPAKARYIWVDAVCINQQDKQERADQVAKLLQVYQKAACVIAWLGVGDTDSALAMAFLNDCDESKLKSDQLLGKCHTEPCLSRLNRIHDALTAIYGRSWLNRTWVRQEVFAARSLAVQCGSQTVDWEAFINGARLMSVTGPVLNKPPTSEGTLLLEDFSRSAMSKSMALMTSKFPGILTDVLLSSRYFAVTDESDTVYAVLNMAGVPIGTNGSGLVEKALSRDEFVVDYSRGVAQVSTNVATFLFRRAGSNERLAAIYKYYVRCDQHAQDLPTWAMNWRLSRCSNEDMAAINSLSIEEWCAWPKTFTMEDSATRCDLEARCGLHLTANVTWQWPTASETDPSILEVRGTVLNYVAYLSEYIWDPDRFIVHTSRFGLGLGAKNIHLKSKPGRLQHIFYKRPIDLEAFDPARHSRRLAILGVGNDAQIALVPSAAQQGDLVVAIAPDTLPVLLRSLGDDFTAMGTYAANDPYRNLEDHDTHLAQDYILPLLREILVWRVQGTFAFFYGIVKWSKTGNESSYLYIDFGVFRTLLFL